DAGCMQSENPRVLGIEGGGTKTEWALFEGDALIGDGVLPGSNFQLTSPARLSDLFSVLPHDVSHVGLYLAGAGSPDDRRRLQAFATEEWPGARISVGSDRESAMATAFGDRDGIAVIAGTGAAVQGRKAGRAERAGGWGHVLGDRGGGYDLARQGLRIVLTRYDLEQSVAPLAARILQDLGLNSLQELGVWAMSADKMSVARLAPAVFAAARKGDSEMLDVLQSGASILADFTRAVAERLDFAAPDVRLIGGLFVHHPDYVSLFTYRLSVLLPGAKVSVCKESGAIGAAGLALRESGSPSGTTLMTIRRSISRPADTAQLAVATTEQVNPRSEHLDTLSNREIVELFIDEEKHVVEAMMACRQPLTAALDMICAAMQNGGRLFYIGAGTSGRLGVLDASEIPPTFGAPPESVQGIIAGGVGALHRAVEGAEDQPEAGAIAVSERGLKKSDVICGLTASGRTPFVMGGLARAKKIGAQTVLVTCNPARARSETPWDVEIDLPTGPELVTGSTRLKAGTATKLALNLFSTAAMVRLGRVRGNRMIDVGISNEKLRDRGARLVMEALGISHTDAWAKLAAAGWNVRTCLDANAPVGGG
ncbi:MAG: N-acetylmuramic acid 6-phosphate etherase, partial [Chthoniobacteraceae bacterium]